MIGNRIKEKRLALDATQDEMALKIGVSRKYYGSLERNDVSPGLQTLLDIADALDCSVDYLLSGGDCTQSPIRKETGKYLKKTYKGWVCTAKACPWRDQTGFCNSGAGCLKEWEESRKNG